jgi:hypothetical protein
VATDQASGAAPEPTARSAATQELTGAPSPNASAVTTPTPAELVREPDFFERSPDGRWTASSFDYYPPIRMQVGRADGSAAWQVESDGEGWPEVILRPVHWSIDGRYLYFTLAPFVDGFVLYVSGSGLERLDLSDGRVAEVLAGKRQLQSFSVSPDSSRLAYIRSDEVTEWLVVRDLGDETELEWGLADQPVQAGKITWSPDASELVLLVTQGFSMEEALTDLMLVNLPTHAQKTVLRGDPRSFYLIRWLDGRTLYLEDRTVTGWSLDLQTGEMTLTATPMPSPQGMTSQRWG